MLFPFSLRIPNQTEGQVQIREGFHFLCIWALEFIQDTFVQDTESSACNVSDLLVQYKEVSYHYAVPLGALPLRGVIRVANFFTDY